jgi:mycothiol synthase
MNEFLAAEHSRPALYMIHVGPRPASTAPLVPPGYEIAAVPSEDVARARYVIELDGSLTDAQWENFASLLLPDALFVARHVETGAWVGTASAVHNPRGSRFYFPGGGEIGYLVVDPAHRRHGLGFALVGTVLARLTRAGYRHVWLGVQGWRLPAIRTHLAMGFAPFLHPPDPEMLSARWQRVFDALSRPADPSAWPRHLSTSR